MFCAFAQVLVLLDVTPDQSMVDEGVAREVINRIQKLRKKVRNQCFGTKHFHFLFSNLGNVQQKRTFLIKYEALCHVLLMYDFDWIPLQEL